MKTGHVSPHVSPITAEAFCASIEVALSCPPDVEGSIRRIQNTLNALPEGKLYYSEQGKKVSFSTVVNGKQTYISKKSGRIHALARRRYQKELLEILKLTGSNRESDVKRRKKLIDKLQKFIRVCEKGNLDITRIILTKKQYSWFSANFRQKSINPDTLFRSVGGLPVRSKSERDIVNTCESWALPLHYEEEAVIYVRPLVTKLREELLEDGYRFKDGGLYTFRNGRIHWNVPPVLEWMNAHGSIWNTYDPQSGTIAIFNDLKGIFADGSLFIWEHEGKIMFFVYRCNASERGAVLILTETVSRDHFIETYENEIDTPEKRDEIVARFIIPRIWF